MAKRSITRREETGHPDARREAQQVDLIRRAAGVDTYIGRGASGYHFGRYVCRDCPDDRHTPPCRPFRLNSHIQEHLAANPTHRVAYFCWDDMEFEDEWLNVDAPYRSRDKPLVVARRPNRLGLPPPVSPTAILASLETLRRAGYVMDSESPMPPEPEKVYLTAGEAETLAIIRKRAGITVQELADRLDVSYSTARNRVRMLAAAGCVKGDVRVYEEGWQVPRRLFAAHDKPIAHVRPREQVRIPKGRRGKGGLPND